MKVLIVGAGTTGLTAACALSLQGIDCQIIERRSQPTQLSRAVGIFPSTIDLLSSIGVSADLFSEAVPMRGLQYLRNGRRLLFLDFTSKEYLGKTGLFFPQNRTEAVLASVLRQRGVNVQYGLQLTDITSQNSSAIVEYSNHHRESFDWVIGADGVHSLVRQKMGIGYPGLDLPERWSIADVEVNGYMPPNLVTVNLQEPSNSLSIILPLGQGRVRVVSSKEDALSVLLQPLDIKKIHSQGSFQISVRQAETYYKNRVLLAGDAAHCHSPVGGKGMNLGIADAVAAARAIFRGEIEQYACERHKIAKEVIKKTEFARKIVTSNNLMMKCGLWVLAKTIEVVPAMRRGYIRHLMEI
ncbi:FAD-dependent oxidoreductase [Microbulbifer variabilis]|uniref:FAD-dependent oxidoreductase n=1 Tax=Microbulbifer variabilis TaxID=266805 RepID=UPI001CFD51B7|nr:NAD(P)/FAD-dependent oxidoreductase [Microbulbifer variabilis]